MPAADIADLADRIFRESGYTGHEGGNLWGVAALVHLGTGEISESELWSACRGAQLNGRNKAAHFFATLNETLRKRGLDLTELLRTVQITPEWPKSRPKKPKAAAVRLKSANDDETPDSRLAELERLERTEAQSR